MTDDHDRERDFEFSHKLTRPESNVSENVLNGRSSEPTSSRNVSHSDWLVASLRAGQPQPFELVRLWRQIEAGTWRFRDTFSSAERHFAVFEACSLGAPRHLQARNLRILERVLLGDAPKAVAYDLKLAPSTVAAAVQSCFSWMGLRCRVASSPVMLTMAVRAARGLEPAPALGRLASAEVDAQPYWLISVPRPDLNFPVRLSPAEAVVVRQLVAGRTHAEISAERATSQRTVANQLAAAFRKFGVSGRGAVLNQLISHCGNAPLGM
jgi:DNA-binding NarL/FixJ family response regulator